MYLWQPEAFNSNTVDGTIVSKRAVPTSGRFGNDLIKLTFFYEINGAIYRSSICSLEHPVIPERHASKFLLDHTYTVLYDPEDLSKAILKNCDAEGYEFGGIRILILSFIFSLIVSIRSTDKITFWSR